MMLLSNLQLEYLSFNTNIHASLGDLPLLPAGTLSFDASLSPSHFMLPCHLQSWSCLLSFDFDASLSPIWLQCFSFIFSLHTSDSVSTSMHLSSLVQFHHFDCDASVSTSALMLLFQYSISTLTLIHPIQNLTMVFQFNLQGWYSYLRFDSNISVSPLSLIILSHILLKCFSFNFKFDAPISNFTLVFHCHLQGWCSSCQFDFDVSFFSFDIDAQLFKFNFGVSLSSSRLTFISPVWLWCFILIFKFDVHHITLTFIFHSHLQDWCLFLKFDFDVSFSLSRLMHISQIQLWCFILIFKIDVHFSSLTLMSHSHYQEWCLYLKFDFGVSFSFSRLMLLLQI